MTKPPMWAFQEIGVSHLRRVPRGALFIDMALGKTRMVLEALKPEHLPALVVAPKRVAEEVWPIEREKWRPDLSMRLAIGSRDHRLKVLGQPADITVISWDNMADALHNPRWKTLVLDELSGYKGRGARWKTAKQLQERAKHVWGMTGTPAPNGYLDLWPQVSLLDRGERLGKNITTYRSRYFDVGWRLPNGVVTRWDMKTGAKEKIDALLEDICLSITAEGRLDLPPVVYNPVLVTLPAAVKTKYKEFQKNLLTNLDIFGGEIHTAGSAGIVSGRLSQLAAGFMYVDEQETRGGAYDWVHDEKINATKEVIAETGSPILVFYRFKPEFERLRKAIPEARSITEPGIVKEWNRGEVPVLLAHPQAAGHGLNMQDGGHTVVWTSMPWDLEQWQQANKRLPRPGQKHANVVVHMIMAKGSVDAQILRRLNGKASVQDSLREALESPL